MRLSGIIESDSMTVTGSVKKTAHGKVILLKKGTARTSPVLRIPDMGKQYLAKL